METDRPSGDIFCKWNREKICPQIGYGGGKGKLKDETKVSGLCHSLTREILEQKQVWEWKPKVLFWTCEL